MPDGHFDVQLESLSSFITDVKKHTPAVLWSSQ